MATTVKKQGMMAAIKEIIVLLIIVFLIRTFGFGLYQVPTGSMETTILVGERFFADKFTVLFSPIQRGEIIAFNQPETQFEYSSNPFKRWFQRYVWGPVNLTKRVIGIPGDRLKGVIEDGHPVIYVNDKKLDEPYVNKYPLVYSLKDDPKKVEQVIEQQIANMLLTRRIDSSQVNAYRAELFDKYVVLKTYDPAFSFANQPFYELKKDRVLVGPDGKPIMIMPGTVSNPGIKPAEHGKNRWGGNSDEFYIELGPNEYWCMGDNRLGSGDSRSFGPVNGEHIHARIIFRIWSIDSDESWWIVDLLRHPIDFWKRVRWNRFLQTVH